MFAALLITRFKWMMIYLITIKFWFKYHMAGPEIGLLFIAVTSRDKKAYLITGNNSTVGSTMCSS